MKSIVDQHGKQFKPSPFSILSERLNKLAEASMQVATKPSEWDAWSRLSQLRQSCGAPPQTITFRRPMPVYLQRNDMK